MPLEMHGYANLSAASYSRLNSTDTRERRLFLCSTINLYVSFDAGVTSQIVLFNETSAQLLDLGTRKPCDVYVKPTYTDTTMRASLFSLDPGEAR